MQKSELTSKLNNAIDFLKKDLASIRAGRATTSLVEDLTIDAYGTKMTVREVASVTTPDAQLILISPWDKGMIKEIDKAIRNANLGLNPVPDSQVLKVPVPALTEERRKEFVKMVSEKAEVCKQVVRGIRQEAMKDNDRDFSDKLITEDEKFKNKEDIEKTVKDYIEKVEDHTEIKKKELMTV